MHPIRTRLNAALLAPVFAATLAALLPAASAQAAAIIGASSATVVSGGASLLNTQVSSTINQSGLTAVYTSGQGDFASFVANTVHQSAFVSNIWFTQPGTTKEQVRFTFGAPVVIDALALWATNNGSGIKDFELFGDAGQSLGTYTAAGHFFTYSGFLIPSSAQVFNFAAVSTSSISLAFSSNYGNQAYSGFGEVAFRAGTLPSTTLNTGSTTAAVPEPGSFALAGLALAGLGLSRRRRG